VNILSLRAKRNLKNYSHPGLDLKIANLLDCKKSNEREIVKKAINAITRHLAQKSAF
jgi:hypothetical protein